MPLILFCEVLIGQWIWIYFEYFSSHVHVGVSKCNNLLLLVSGWPSGLSLPKSLWPSRQRTGHQVESLLWKHHSILLWRHLRKCPACLLLDAGFYQKWQGLKRWKTFCTDEITALSLLATGPGSHNVVGEERLDSALLPAVVGLKMTDVKCCWQMTAGRPAPDYLTGHETQDQIPTTITFNLRFSIT